MKANECVYSMPYIVGEDARVLILGSMPGRESLAKQQYYANPRNQFWMIMYALFDKGYDQPSYEEKVGFIKRHRIALWDSIHYCVRKGSLDSAIKDEEPNDVAGLLNHNPEIKAIVFNGSKSFAVFKKFFKSVIPTTIDLLKMPSTSPTPSRYPKTLDEKINDWSKIKNYL
ncbi:DNA-deoxyinosine glycosylase [Sporolactobacillus nakayamae]|uniref:G/U mismatch-specific uracil-DNA glycosylase n=1 Tax=Sporolactobacillus nakayamae TaxID=269670 RepID=A0A1I2QIX9_9BACL|nr:DNA-deoxyinosine glycosylase [Sporolactobacillus nakayamae]SFG27930.1 G/U mismatch-specific uracil-DNA glycosylase [Sporolactobacillus nakayamae]